MPLGRSGTGIKLPIELPYRHPRLLTGIGYTASRPALPVPGAPADALGGRFVPASNTMERDSGAASALAAHVQNADLIALAAVDEEQDAAGSNADIWRDALTLRYLEERTHAEDTTLAERKRIQKRSKVYAFAAGKLYRKMADGSTRIVPRPSEREQLIAAMHNASGHFGERRTVSLLMHTHWWHNMYKDVAQAVRQCKVCDRVRSTFDTPQPELRPLPIEGMFYRWGVDLTGPFPTTPTGNRYVMVMIEHFSKTLELAAIPAKDAEHTRAVFLQRVLGRYGACAEVVTDQGTEFQGVLDELLEACFIDHRVTSANHPQADGLAERAVQTVKHALRKRCELDRKSDTWDEALPWIMLGYNASTQKASGMSPYYMLYARHPVVPPAVKERMQDPLVLTDTPQAQELAAEIVLQRADAVRKACTMATENLKIAQHRDTLRYSTTRSGGYMPKLRKFDVGDFVYVRYGELNSKLQIPARREILRVVEIRPAGTLVLQGKCGRTITNHSRNCAPCHLPNIDSTIDVMLADPDSSLACELCNFTDKGDIMLLCDYCGTGWHTHCLTPKLNTVPEGVWICPRCTELGVSEQQVLQRAQAAGGQPEPEMAATRIFPSKAVRTRINKARALHNRVVQMHVPNGESRRKQLCWGRVEYLGDEHRPWCYTVHFTNGYKENFTWAKLHKLVAPEGTEMPTAEPAAEAAMATAALPNGLSHLPRTWQLDTREGVLRALELLMPGEHGTAHATRLSRQMPGQPNFLQKPGQHTPGEPECVHTMPGEVQRLLDALDFSTMHRILDPWSGTGGVAKMFRKAGVHVVTNDINSAHAADTHEDALQPSFYHKLLQDGPIDAIVMSPWFAMLDLALPLAVLAASVVVCAHVPGHYFTNATGPRHQWLGNLVNSGRVQFIWGLPRGPMGRRCAWLIVFASTELRKKLVKPEYRTDSCIIF